MKNLALENYDLVEMNSVELKEANGGSILTGLGVTSWMVKEISTFKAEFTEAMKSCNCL